MQFARDSVSMLVMRREMAGGQCEFLKDPPAGVITPDMPHLKPVCFGSLKFKGYERKLYSYLGKGFDGDWGLRKFHL